MVKKHYVRKHEEYNKEGGLVSSTEEHLIVEKHNFLEDVDEDEADLMFLGKKQMIEIDDDAPLIIINNDDNFW